MLLHLVRAGKFPDIGQEKQICRVIGAAMTSLKVESCNFLEALDVQLRRF